MTQREGSAKTSASPTSNRRSSRPLGCQVTLESEGLANLLGESRIARGNELLLALHGPADLAKTVEPVIEIDRNAFKIDSCPTCRVEHVVTRQEVPRSEALLDLDRGVGETRGDVAQADRAVANADSTLVLAV